MNTRHFQYVLEIKQAGSISQAAENLFMTQPTLSKAVKELESNLGFEIFKRSSRGVVPTKKGAEFLIHAKRIVSQIEKMELALHTRHTDHQMFSLAIPRVSYIARAASDFICSFDKEKGMEIDVLETTSTRVIDAVADGHFVLGIIRCHAEDEDYFLKSLSRKGLQYETLWKSRYVALMRNDHPLAGRSVLSPQDLEPYIEILFGDDEVPFIQVSEARTAGGTPGVPRRILVYDRAMQFDLLRASRYAYMWVSPLPGDLLLKNGLIQQKCPQGSQFVDLLISRSGYHFSKLDHAFIDRLYLQKNEVAYGDTFS